MEKKGIVFMTEMLELSKQKSFQLKHSANVLVDDYRPVSVVLLSSPFNGTKEYLAGPAQFGLDFRQNYGIFGKLLLADPIDACTPLSISSSLTLHDKILVAKRGGCMFVDKARKAQGIGALGIIIVDNLEDTSHSTSALFAMSGDGVQDVNIPSLFLFGKEGNDLLWNMRAANEMIVFMGEFSTKNGPKQMNGIEKALSYNTEQLKSIIFSDFKSKKANFISLFNKHVKNPNQQCKVSDYKHLKFFYDIINPSEVNINLNINNNNNINNVNNNRYENEMKVIILDDAIEIFVYDTANRQLNVNFQNLKNSLQDNSNNEEIERKLYDQLIFRLEKKTNFLTLKNSNSFKKPLFNLVKSHLNSDFKETNEDALLLKILANKLQTKPKTVEIVSENTKDEN
jgi:hypothetical protein